MAPPAPLSLGAAPHDHQCPVTRAQVTSFWWALTQSARWWPGPLSLSSTGCRGVPSRAGRAGERLQVKFSVWGSAAAKVHLLARLLREPCCQGVGGPGAAWGWDHVNLCSAWGPEGRPVHWEGGRCPRWAEAQGETSLAARGSCSFLSSQ